MQQDDARGLADALERALRDPAELAMLRVALEAVRPARDGAVAIAAPLSWAFLRDFIAFLRQGPFVFAWRGD
jgi:hypothetical protein